MPSEAAVILWVRRLKAEQEAEHLAARTEQRERLAAHQADAQGELGEVYASLEALQAETKTRLSVLTEREERLMAREASLTKQVCCGVAAANPAAQVLQWHQPACNLQEQQQLEMRRCATLRQEADSSARGAADRLTKLSAAEAELAKRESALQAAAAELERERIDLAVLRLSQQVSLKLGGGTLYSRLSC